MKKITSASAVYDYVRSYFDECDMKGKDIDLLIFTKEDGTVLEVVERGRGQVVIKIFPNNPERAILVTSHHDGNCLPDKYDIAETRFLKELLKAKDIGLTDHIIIGRKEFYSFAEESIIFVN